MKRLLAVLLLLFSSSGIAQINGDYSSMVRYTSACDQFLAYGYPDPGPKPTILTGFPLCRIAYFTLWSATSRDPIYSAELLLKENVSGVESRVDSFAPDPSLPVGARAELADYRGSGYDRGHLANVGDMRTNSAAQLQSFYLSNMVPQSPPFNQHEWAALEQQVRAYVKVNRPLYVITGAIFASPAPKIGRGVWVPSSLYKVVYDKINNQVACYVMPNANPTGKLASYAVTLESLEAITHLSLFPTMPAEIRSKLRQSPLKSGW
jgi:endonuclease G